ncbi:voltage-dependent calcium channel subunit alpha-2/delta-1-like [Anneissia japonica]|uniref:voltage-dependent calcium channel subunit alpha-2/delta-1-like n=1 Tax=Anneissia japonica TaxID=1529436 RepID=UPI001425A339|nr:voltage-dependent calcium channel subunit alpha-2/delta-1-like [Anneissia japonica]
MSIYLRNEVFEDTIRLSKDYCTDKRIICYLVDDGGFLISSNLDSTTNVGRFFGMFEGDIMRQLTSSGIYDKEELYDFQASCESEETIFSFGVKSFYVPTIAEFINFNWFVTSASWSFVKQIFYQILTGDFSIFTVFGQEVTTESKEGEEPNIEKPPGNESCIKKQRLWHFGNLQSAEGNVTKINCIRNWKAARLDLDSSDLKPTNLLLVVVDAPDNSTYCPSRALSQEPEKDSGPKPEDEAKNPRYRRRPKSCFYTHPGEQHICSGAIIVGPLLWLLVAVQMLLIFHQWV